MPTARPDPATLAKILAQSGQTAAPKAKLRAPRPMVAPTVSLVVVIPVRTGYTLNSRSAHWAARHRRVKAEREAVREALFVLVGAPPGWLRRGRVAVTLTRLGGGHMDDDNLASALKGCRDQLAEWLGRDDGDESLTFDYAQSPGGAVGVRVTLSPTEDRS